MSCRLEYSQWTPKQLTPVRKLIESAKLAQSWIRKRRRLQQILIWLLGNAIQKHLRIIRLIKLHAKFAGWYILSVETVLCKYYICLLVSVWLLSWWHYLRHCFPQSIVCILYSLQSKAIRMGSALETTTFCCQSATILVASLLIYVVFFDLNRFLWSFYVSWLPVFIFLCMF